MIRRLLREPLVPPDVDLHDYAYMPLEIARLRKSKAWLMAKRKPELAFYMLNLWTAAWHERPAGSLEDDDDVLADRAMCAPEHWPGVRPEVLHGFVKCADGRLYHPTVAEKVLEAWASKLAWRGRTKAAREARQQNRLQSQSQPPSQSLSGTGSDPVTGLSRGRSNGATAHKGEGEGKGEESDKTSPPTPRAGAASLTRARTPERLRHDASRSAWVTAEIARKAGTWDALQKSDPLVAEAVRLIGGFTAIGMERTDRMGRVRARFREVYEQLLDKTRSPS